MRRVLDKKELASGRWLRMLEVSYSIDDEKTGKWEMVERTTKNQESDGNNNFIFRYLHVHRSGYYCNFEKAC